MSEMIERVARAIYYGTAGDKGREGSFESDTGIGTDSCRDMARAAIAAMREPTKAMIDAVPVGEAITDGQIYSIWCPMIDEALK